MPLTFVITEPNIPPKIEQLIPTAITKIKILSPLFPLLGALLFVILLP